MARLEQSIPNYSRRDLIIDVEDLPVGYDLVTDTIRVRAPYNADCKIIIGNDDNLAVIGRSLNQDNEPIAFIASKGKRIRYGKEVEFFTNEGAAITTIEQEAQTVVVSAPRIKRVTQNIDRIGRGNSLTISLPRRQKL